MAGKGNAKIEQLKPLSRFLHSKLSSNEQIAFPKIWVELLERLCNTEITRNSAELSTPPVPPEIDESELFFLSLSFFFSLFHSQLSCGRKWEKVLLISSLSSSSSSSLLLRPYFIMTIFGLDSSLLEEGHGDRSSRIIPLPFLQYWYLTPVHY